MNAVEQSDRGPDSSLGDGNKGHHDDFFVVIEGIEHGWPRNMITTEEIAELGGWDLSQGVIEVDDDNNEHTLQPHEVVQLKEGHGFGKKHKWKRG